MIAASPSRRAAEQEAARDVYFQFQSLPSAVLPQAALRSPAVPRHRPAKPPQKPPKNLAWLGYALFALGYLFVVGIFYAIFFGQLPG